VLAWLDECATLAQPQLLEDLRRRTEAGECGLQQIQSNECRQQKPVGAYEQAKRQADEDHNSSESKNCPIDIHHPSPNKQALMAIATCKLPSSSPDRCA
jgi:hypothetical protein